MSGSNDKLTTIYLHHLLLCRMKDPLPLRQGQGHTLRSKITNFIHYSAMTTVCIKAFCNTWGSRSRSHTEIKCYKFWFIMPYLLGFYNTSRDFKMPWFYCSLLSGSEAHPWPMSLWPRSRSHTFPCSPPFISRVITSSNLHMHFIDKIALPQSIRKKE